MPTMKIGSLTLTLPSPYSSGHVCSSVEARVLNNEHNRRLRRNIKTRCAEAEAGTDLQLQLTAYIRGYTLDGGDPINPIARELALSIVRHAVKANGKPLGHYSKAALKAEAEKLLKGPQASHILALAKRRLREIQDAAQAEIDLRERT